MVRMERWCVRQPTDVADKVLWSFSSVDKMLTVIVVRICALSALHSDKWRNSVTQSRVKVN